MLTGTQIAPLAGTWVVRVGGAVIAETTNAVSVREPGYDEVVYFPRDAVAMAFLEPSDHTSHCPKKGDASYFHLSSPEGMLDNVAWSYENPLAEAKDLANRIAFYSDRATVEQL